MTENIYKIIFDNARDGIILHDMEGRFLEVNKAFCRRLEYTRDEMLTMTIADIKPGKDVAVIQERLGALKKHGHLAFETCHLSRNGKMIPTEIRSRVVTVQGQQLILSVARDITQQKKEKLALLRYQQIISATDDLMAFVDSDLVYRKINHAYCKAHGKDVEQILGRSVQELHGKGVFTQTIIDRLIQCLKGEVVRYQAWFDYPALGRKMMNVTYYPFREHGSPEVSGIIVIRRDVTKRVEAEKSLHAEMERRRDAYISMQVLLDKYKEARRDIEQQVTAQLNKFIFPYLGYLEQAITAEIPRVNLRVLRAHLELITDPFAKHLSDPSLGLTPREILVADLVKQGKSTKNIARLLNLSQRTIDAYRNSLRKKLNLTNKKINLRTHLRSVYSRQE